MNAAQDFNAYLFCITRNMVKDYWCKQAYERNHRINFQQQAQTTSLPNNNKELTHIFQEANEQLPAQKRRSLSHRICDTCLSKMVTDELLMSYTLVHLISKVSMQ